jgi:CO dehydrogenase/acetyl-CoA synthase beta subunit
MYREFKMREPSLWPVTVKGNVVLGADTAVELGNPNDESASFMVWSERTETINNGLVTLIGSDLGEAQQKGLPFGKVVLLGTRGMNEENCYDRHRELDLVRYDLKLQGYMMRAVSQYMREWSRVSNDAIERGFSFEILGSSLAGLYRRFDYVESVEIVFVTSSREDVRELGVLAGKATRLINALNKMNEEVTFECGSCDYVDVCSEVEDLRKIRGTMTKE